MVDPISEYKSDVRSVAIYVGAGLVSRQQVHVSFDIPTEESKSTPTIIANIPSDDCTCKECNGTGKVKLNAWALFKKRGELSNKQISSEERLPDFPYEEDRNWIWVPMLDLNDKPILGDDGFPIMIQIEDLGGSWVLALDDDGSPILDANGTPIQIFIPHLP